MYANRRYPEAKLKGGGGVARSLGKEGLFGGSNRIILSSDTGVNFTIHSGPPLHAKYPGGTHRTGGDLSSNRVHFRVCLGTEAVMCPDWRGVEL